MTAQREWFEKDYYRTLGVDSSTSAKDITRAYRKLARKLHPDANPGDQAAEQRFKEVSAAYDVLGDEARRVEYDQVRTRGPMPGGGGFGGGGFPGAGGFDMGDLFGGMFGSRGHGGQQGRRGDDLETRLTLSFVEAVNGVTTTIHLVSDAAYLSGKTLVDGSILIFDGQVTVYEPGRGCYRCLFPEPPPPGLVPNCAEAGVLGALTGLVGSIQATEALKLILGIGESLVSRLLLIDALSMSFREVRLKRNPSCPLCGDNPTVTELIDYEIFCGLTTPEAAGVSSN